MVALGVGAPCVPVANMKRELDAGGQGACVVCVCTQMRARAPWCTHSPLACHTRPRCEININNTSKNCNIMHVRANNPSHLHRSTAYLHELSAAASAAAVSAIDIEGNTPMQAKSHHC